MTRTQRKLARHALGLPNQNGRSYRNRFVCVYRPGNYDHWSDMMDRGWADAMPIRSGSMRRFWLTPEGAALAIDPGESLCPEDFPEVQP